MDNSEFNKKLEDLFSYHPPQTPEDQAKHDLVNKACLDCAKSLSEVVKNPAELTTILRELQKVRMLANFSVSCSHTGIAYRDLFEPDSAASK